MSNMSNTTLLYIEGMIELIDSFDRATQASIQELGIDSSTVKGLVATLKKANSILDRFHVTVISPNLLHKFNPQIHQAISRVPVDSTLDNTVQKCWSRGYIYNGRLIKPADVTVGVYQQF